MTLSPEISDINCMNIKNGVEKVTDEMLCEIAGLEKVCFSSPWSEASLKLLTGESGVGFVAFSDGVLAAYGGMLTVLDEGQITNIATHPSFRRKGLARQILSAIEEYSKAHAITLLSLEVRESNAAARALYSSCGWQEMGVRKNFYKLPSENAVVMTKML